METYSASFDKTVYIVTCIPIAICFVFVLLYIYKRLAIVGIVAIVNIITVAIGYMYSVSCYQANQKELIIKRPLSYFNKEIPFTEIDSVHLVTDNEKKEK